MYYLVFQTDEGNEGKVVREHLFHEGFSPSNLEENQNYLHWCPQCLGQLPGHSANFNGKRVRQLPSELNPKQLRRSAYRMTTDRMIAEKAATEASGGTVPEDINDSAITAKRSEIQEKYPDPEEGQTLISIASIG